MAINTKITIDGNTVDENFTIQISKSTGDNNISSNFTATIDNEDGTHSDSYTVGDEIIIYADVDTNPPTTAIFKGILEDINFDGAPNKEKMTVTGRDYTARLMDRTVEPEVYSNQEVSVIIKDIIDKYVDGITYTNVDTTSTILKRIAFNQKNVYDSIKQLAELVDYNFYVDEDKDLHFEAKSSTSSGQTFNNTNVLKAKFKTHRNTVKNQIWVYGDRYLDARRDVINADGGSVFTLTYPPHNTNVSYGAVQKKGAIYNMGYASGTNYLVNFHDRQIIFVSGTTYGDNIPTSGGSVVINYDRDLPIVKVGDNYASQDSYGKRVHIVVDKDIKDPDAAQDRLESELDTLSEPAKEGNISVKGVLAITPTQTCIVDLPYHDVDNKTYEILEARYNFNKTNNATESVLSLKLNKKLDDITDALKGLLTDVQRIQGGDINDTDVITRFQHTTGSVGLRQSGCIVSSTPIGSSFILGHPINGLLGSYSTHTLGRWPGSTIVVWSGCYP